MASTPVERAAGAGAATDGGRSATVCPNFHAAVELVGRRWAGAILVTLLDGPRFYRELGAAIPGVSDRLLSQRLRELEAEGVVSREVHDGPPARVSYSLTELGSELEPAIRELHRWAERWEESNGKRHSA